MSNPTRGIPFNLPNPPGVSVGIEVASADGAITVRNCAVIITKGTAAALTLAAPTEDGLWLAFTSATAAAHTIDMASSGINGGSGDVGTFGGAIGDCVEIFSYNGHWYQRSNLNVTWA